ncbi:unnamed protein product [Symbiodinium pilosum]|uniref:Uncharacterized protein n=1 Tax=Symbiodinium pilosum TaxID=2952 RepID=A0A812W1F5_SYMPI|nr:unnamed protein product [Symbiodinium pilosum]
MMLASLICFTLLTGSAAEGLRGEAGLGRNASSAMNSTKSNATAAVKSATGYGYCSATDQSLMTAFGGGAGANSFPRILSDCGKRSFNIFTGFRQNDFVRCVTDSTQLQSTCASCFAISASYGASNCKWSCFWGSWCGQGCLNCVGVKNGEVQDCAGETIRIPTTTSC